MNEVKNERNELNDPSGSNPKSQGCLGEQIWTDYGYEYDCGYGTTIDCDQCKYGGGRKDPAAKCNQD